MGDQGIPTLMVQESPQDMGKVMQDILIHMECVPWHFQHLMDWERLQRVQLAMKQVPGDDDKRDPERESWPRRVMLPILPIQSISGSRLPSPPGTPETVYRKTCYRIDVLADVDIG